MWYLEKDITISAAHHLENYEGKCKNLHGHSWKITVYCKGDKLNKSDILIDFTEIKNIVNQLDHTDLNTIFSAPQGYESANPTAETIAQYLQREIPFCYKVMVQEEEGSRCFYVEDSRDIS